MFKFWRRKVRLKPDYDDFHRQLIRAAGIEGYDEDMIARDFRALFNSHASGRRVLFVLLSWCGEYDVPGDGDPSPPVESELLQRWAGKREIATKIKTAMFADLNTED